MSIVEKGTNFRAGGSGSGTSIVATGTLGGLTLGTNYAVGDIVQVWVRHRTTISACYLTNSGDPGVGVAYAQRVNVLMNGDTNNPGVRNTDGNEFLEDGTIVVPNNGNTYDRVVVVFTPAGNTGNEVITTAYTMTNGLIQPRNTAGDFPQNPSGIHASPSNITTCPFDVAGPTGGVGELICIAVASSAVLNTQQVLAATGYTLLPVPSGVGSPRLACAYKIVAPSRVTSGGEATSISWAAGTVVCGRAIILQESTVVTLVPLKVHFRGASEGFGVRIAPVDTTVKVPVSMHLASMDRMPVMKVGKVDVVVGGPSGWVPRIITLKGI